MTMKRARLTIITVFCLAILYTLHILPFTVFAQSLPAGAGITLTASSNSPAPGQSVTITAASYSFDINSAAITWTVNGKDVRKGIGATTLGISAPPLGHKTTVNIEADTPDGGVFTDSVSVGSGSVDMIIETDGYVPPFFEGKIPLAYQNAVTVIAVPHLADSYGKEYDPTTLVYDWRKDDGTVLGDQSGYGKQAITMQGSVIPRPYYLIVTATTRDGAAQGQGLAHIVPQSPSITFYDNDPLYGPMFNEAIGDTLFIGSQKEAGAFAALLGFNFSPKNTGALSLDWYINGTDHPELASSRSVVLRAPDGVSGASQISLDASGVQDILQQASAAFNVTFSASPSATSTPVTL